MFKREEVIGDRGVWFSFCTVGHFALLASTDPSSVREKRKGSCREVEAYSPTFS